MAPAGTLLAPSSSTSLYRALKAAWRFSLPGYQATCRCLASSCFLHSATRLMIGRASIGVPVQLPIYMQINDRQGT